MGNTKAHILFPCFVLSPLITVCMDTAQVSPFEQRRQTFQQQLAPLSPSEQTNRFNQTMNPQDLACMVETMLPPELQQLIFHKILSTYSLDGIHPYHGLKNISHTSHLCKHTSYPCFMPHLPNIVACYKECSSFPKQMEKSIVLYDLSKKTVIAAHSIADIVGNNSNTSQLQYLTASPHNSEIALIAQSTDTIYFINDIDQSAQRTSLTIPLADKISTIIYHPTDPNLIGCLEDTFGCWVTQRNRTEEPASRSIARKNCITHCAFFPYDSARLFSNEYFQNWSVSRIRDIEHSTVVNTLKMHAYLYSCSIDPFAPNSIACATGYEGLFLWDIRTKTALHYEVNKPHLVYHSPLTPHLLMTVQADNNMEAYDLRAIDKPLFSLALKFDTDNDGQRGHTIQCDPYKPGRLLVTSSHFMKTNCMWATYETPNPQDAFCHLTPHQLAYCIDHPELQEKALLSPLPSTSQ